ncbi:protein ninF [Enterobacteriaceae bacterium BIT-l23]|uniref:protein NinF n=1 Tax=Jejubacter sp. L23 TaxID=3092086 RepID=UPI00158475FB|nr:protein ninF [Enterobacteriaceae bacterium BIT-l23]
MLTSDQTEQQQSERKITHRCTECGIPLAPDECYVCDSCAIFLYADPNSMMYEGDDDDSV